MCTYMAACDALLCDVQINSSNAVLFTQVYSSGGNTETFLDETFHRVCLEL